MQQTEEVRDKVVLVGLSSPVLKKEENADEDTMEELSALVETAGGETVGIVLQNRPSPDPRTFIGEGKVAEVQLSAAEVTGVIALTEANEAEDAAEDADETDEDTASWSQAFWRESTLTSLLEMLLGFEINKDDWRTLLTGAKARLPEIIARRNDFLQAYQGKRHEYDNLLTYFLYRHFMKALGDDAVQDKVQLALVSTAVIQLLDVYEWLAKGEVTHWAQICICKAYSREIEYNEDNTEQLAAFSVLDEME